MLIRVNQLTDLHNKRIGGFDMTAPHEIAVASFQELMHTHSWAIVENGKWEPS